MIKDRTQKQKEKREKPAYGIDVIDKACKITAKALVGIATEESCGEEFESLPDEVKKHVVASVLAARAVEKDKAKTILQAIASRLSKGGKEGE